MIESLWAVQNINMNRWYTSYKPQLPVCWSSMVQTVFNTIVSSGTLLMSFSLFCNVMLYMCLHTFNSIQLFAGLGTGVSMLSVHLFCFFETQKTQTKFKKSSLIKYPLWGVFQPPSVLKTSAVFVPWTLLTFHGHTDNHSDCFHTKTSKAVCTWFCQWGVQLLTSHVLLVLMQTTHNNTQWIIWHTPQRLQSCLNSLCEPTPAQICRHSLQIEIREWVSECLRNTGGCGCGWASKEKNWSTFSATVPKQFITVGNLVQVRWVAWMWIAVLLSLHSYQSTVLSRTDQNLLNCRGLGALCESKSNLN